MSSLLLILLSAALVSAVVLMSAPQWRPFVGVDSMYAGARGVATASLAIIPAATLIDWALARYILQPLGAEHVRTLAFAAVLLIVVYAAERLLNRASDLMPQRPGFVLLLAANGAAFGAALVAQNEMRSVFDALLLALASAAGFGLLLLALAAMLERLRAADAPAPFREAPLALVTAGLMALGFMGFTGLVQG